MHPGGVAEPNQQAFRAEQASDGLAPLFFPGFVDELVAFGRKFGGRRTDGLDAL